MTRQHKPNSKHRNGRRLKGRRLSYNQGVKSMIKRIEVDADVIRTHSGGGSEQVNVVSVTAHGEARTSDPGAIGFTYTAKLTADEWGELKPILDRIDARMRDALGLDQKEAHPYAGMPAGAAYAKHVKGSGYQPKVER